MSVNAKILEHRLDTDPKPGPLFGCIHIPDYPAQALLRNAPDLRRRPVAVLDGAFPLFTVVATNAFARRMGIRTGMTKLQLEQFPGVVLRHRSEKQEDSAHHALIDCAHFFTPRVEDTAPDTVTLDLNGLSRLWGPPRAMAQRLFRAADALGLEAHIALASNPDAAMHAAKAEAGITVIAGGTEAAKLQSLDLRILAPSEQIHEVFSRWGLRTFGDLTRLPEISVAGRLGQEGVRLQKMAQGATTRPLRVLNEKPYFKESIELEDSVASLEPMIFIFSRLLKQLCQRLEARNRATHALTLSVTLEPVSAPSGNAAHTSSPEILTRTIRLPIPTRDARILLKLLQLDLDRHRPPRPVTALTLAAEPVEPRRAQNGLFHPPTPDPEKLGITLARIGSIVGEKNMGSPTLLDTHRRDAFRMRHFLPPTGRHRKTASRPNAPSMALRIFRPALEARVEVLGGLPYRISFAGKSGTIHSARGPWTSSGEWWRENPWNREEWDVEVRTGQNRGIYRIYQDPNTTHWFVDAIYD